MGGEGSRWERRVEERRRGNMRAEERRVEEIRGWRGEKKGGRKGGKIR